MSWRLITSQHCSGFCHTLTWISHGVTCICILIFWLKKKLWIFFLSIAIFRASQRDGNSLLKQIALKCKNKTKQKQQLDISRARSKIAWPEKKKIKQNDLSIMWEVGKAVLPSHGLYHCLIFISLAYIHFTYIQAYVSNMCIYIYIYIYIWIHSLIHCCYYLFE